LFTLPTVAGYQRWPQANNDVTVKTLYRPDACALASVNITRSQTVTNSRPYFLTALLGDTDVIGHVTI